MSRQKRKTQKQHGISASGGEVREARSAKRRTKSLPGDSRAGFALLLGRPNVGKSTLLNRLVGERIAIVSPRPQTTRTRLLGVVNRPNTQLCLVDAPGVHKAKGLLNRTLVDAALQTIPDMDLVLYLAEAGWPKDKMPEAGPEGEVVLPDDVDPVGPFHRGLLQRLEKEGKPVVLVLNKIDLLPRPLLLPVIQAWQQAFDFKTIYPVSALTGANINGLVDAVREFLPEGPPLFADDVFTDQTERQLCAEFLREQVFLQTRDEIPYGVAVVIDFFDETERWPEGMKAEDEAASHQASGFDEVDEVNEVDELDELNEIDELEGEPELDQDSAAVKDLHAASTPEEGDEGAIFDEAGADEAGALEVGADEAGQLRSDSEKSDAEEEVADLEDAFSDEEDVGDSEEKDGLEFESSSESGSSGGNQAEEPHSRPLRGLVRIHATIVVDRNSHKGIVIGKGGERLRKIATVSRLHMERLLGSRVWLETHVKVDPEWTRKRAKLNEFGLG